MVVLLSCWCGAGPRPWVSGEADGSSEFSDQGEPHQAQRPSTLTLTHPLPQLGDRQAPPPSSARCRLSGWGLRTEHTPEGSATGEETFFQVDRGGCLVCSGTVRASFWRVCSTTRETLPPPPHLGCGIVTCFDGKDSGFSLPPLVHLIVSSRWPRAFPAWGQGAAE